MGAVPRAQLEWEFCLSSLCSCPTQQHRRKLELAPGMDLAWKCHLCPKRICEVSNRDPALRAALQELSQRSWCWHRDAKKGFSSKTHQNRPAPPTVLPRAGPALRSQCQSEIQSKINLLIFIIFFPLESIYQKSPTKNQRLCRGSGKLRCGDWAAKEQGGVRVCYPMLE